MILSFDSKRNGLKKNSCQNEDNIDNSGAITFDSFGGLFLVTGLVTTCCLFASFLMNNYKQYLQNEGTELDDQNQRGNGHNQDREENGDSNDTQN